MVGSERGRWGCGAEDRWMGRIRARGEVEGKRDMEGHGRGRGVERVTGREVGGGGRGRCHREVLHT